MLLLDIITNDIPEYDQIEYKKNPYIPLLIKQANVNYGSQTNQELEYYNQNSPENVDELAKGIRLVKRNAPMDAIENDPPIMETQTEESSKMPMAFETENETDWKPSINTVEEFDAQQTIDSNQFISDTFGPDKKGDGPHFHVTYWMFYPYSQGKQMCTLSLGPLGKLPIPLIFGMCLGTRTDFGSHVGDWEHMTLYFKGNSEPEVSIRSTIQSTKGLVHL